MTTLTTTSPGAFLPEEIGALLIQPTIEAAVSTQVSTTVTTEAHVYKVPIVKADPSASWTAEGQEIAPSDPLLGEVDIAFKKLAGLTIVSNEMLDDSNPDAAEIVGAGLARDLATKLDAAYFGTAGANTLQPKGLGDLPTSGAGAVTVVDAGTAWTNFDPFVEATYAAAAVGAATTAFVANPADALTLARLKVQSGSIANALQPDPTQAGRKVISGVLLYTSPAVEEGVVWAIPDGGRSLIVIRKDATVDSDTSPFYTSDRTAIRAIMRVGIGFPHPAGIVKITLTP